MTDIDLDALEDRLPSLLGTSGRLLMDFETVQALIERVRIAESHCDEMVKQELEALERAEIAEADADRLAAMVYMGVYDTDELMFDSETALNLHREAVAKRGEQ